jgi:hypothetical protein
VRDWLQHPDGIPGTASAMDVSFSPSLSLLILSHAQDLMYNIRSIV